jgi:hypothetical protein
MNNSSNDFNSKVKKILPSIKILGSYINSKSKILVQDNLGIRYEVFPEALLRGSHPQITSALDINEAFAKKLKQKHQNLILLSNYKGANDKILVQDDLGIKYQVTPSSLLLSTNKPSIKAAVDKTEAFKRMAYQKRSDCQIIGDYKGDKAEILIKDKNGVNHKMLPYNILKGNGLTLKSAVHKSEYIRAIIKINHPELKLISKYKNAYDKIIVEDELGIKYAILFNNLIKSKRPISIKSAMNKDLAISKIISSLRNDIIKTSKYSSAKEQLLVTDINGFIHRMSIYGLIDGNALGFNSVVDNTAYFDFLFNRLNKHKYRRIGKYNGYKMPIKMNCPKHGDFDSSPEKLLLGSFCKSCYKDSRMHTLEYFIQRANVIHDNKYDYSKSSYAGFDSRIDIICPKHGVFNQLVKGHLSGKGCKICVQENQAGTLASVSKYNPMLNYKLYKFIIWSDDKREVFGKVGLTLDVKRRIWGIPYNVDVIEVKEGTIGELFKEEQKFVSKIRLAGLQYTPEIKFGGYTECYKLTNIELEQFQSRSTAFANTVVS